MLHVATCTDVICDIVCRVCREEMQQRCSMTVNSVAISCPDTRQDMIIEPSKPSDLAGNAPFVTAFAYLHDSFQ